MPDSAPLTVRRTSAATLRITRIFAARVMRFWPKSRLLLDASSKIVAGRLKNPISSCALRQAKTTAHTARTLITIPRATSQINNIAPKARSPGEPGALRGLSKPSRDRRICNGNSCTMAARMTTIGNVLSNGINSELALSTLDKLGTKCRKTTTPNTVKSSTALPSQNIVARLA